MSTKSTAVMMQLTSRDGTQRVQMLALPSGSVFRRTLVTGSQTRWRRVVISSGDLAGWVPNFVSLSAKAPTPMDVTQGPVLIEVTTDEKTKADDKGTLERNVTLRVGRVLEAMDAGTLPIMPSQPLAEYVEAWLKASTEDDNSWLDLNIHPNGSAKEPAPTAAPKPEPVVEPVVDPTVSSAWKYPAIVGGYVTRPNGEKYKVRKIEGVIDVTVIRDSRALREHVLLTGEPGTGKTALLDSAFGTEMVNMLGTEDTSVDDFIGNWQQVGTNPDGTPKYAWIDGALLEAMERGVPLYIDEVGVIFPKVMTTTFSVMDGRDEIRITANPARGTVKAKEGFVVIAATNPKAPGVRLSEALLSRFGLHIEVGTDYQAMRDMGVPDELVTAASNLDVRRKTGEIAYAPQARELLRAARQYKSRGEMIALRNLISSAPEEVRPIVAEVLKSTIGRPITKLEL